MDSESLEDILGLLRRQNRMLEEILNLLAEQSVRDERKSASPRPPAAPHLG